MDIADIKDEVYNFGDVFFREVSDVFEDGFNFIEKNDLIQPKENYVKILDYLNMMIEYFYELDRTIMDSTLIKLHHDVKHLNDLYNKQKKVLQNVEEIFKKEFKKESNILKTFIKEILKYKNADNLSNEEKSELSFLLQYYKDLNAICFGTFNKIFQEDTKYVISSLLLVLNSKIYYLHEMFWQNASQSAPIQRHFKIKKINNGVSSKNYLKHRISTMVPNSKDYQYFKDCLRVYK